MGTKIATTIDLKGPFFTKQPGKTFRQNVRVMMAAVAAEGEADVQAQLRAGEGNRRRISHGVAPDRVSGHAVGRVHSLGGNLWAVTAVISVNNSGLTPAQGIALMAAAAVVERQTHAFRRTTGRLRRARSVNTTELLKGIDDG